MASISCAARCGRRDWGLTRWVRVPSEAARARSNRCWVSAAPIISSAVTSVFLRPSRSPKCPKRMLPNGLATSATPRVANDATVPATEPSAGKNSLPNTSAAAKP